MKQTIISEKESNIEDPSRGEKSIVYQKKKNKSMSIVDLTNDSMGSKKD
jgi:hypothetical protein